GPPDAGGISPRAARRRDARRDDQPALNITVEKWQARVRGMKRSRRAPELSLPARDALRAGRRHCDGSRRRRRAPEALITGGATRPEPASDDRASWWW